MTRDVCDFVLYSWGQFCPHFHGFVKVKVDQVIYSCIIMRIQVKRDKVANNKGFIGINSII